MTILEKGNGYLYRLNCPDCGSKLEAEANELETILEDYEVEFTCPVCQEIRRISWIHFNKVRKPINKEES